MPAFAPFIQPAAGGMPTTITTSEPQTRPPRTHCCSWLHVIHHKYNKGDQMSPFAGLAFHPLDGIMQARHRMVVVVLQLMPCA